MLAFAGMIAGHAKEAGMAVPKNPDGRWSTKKFPHFAVYCNVQLCRPILNWSEVSDNAAIIAKIPDTKIKKVTLVDLLKLGIHIST